MSLSLHEIDSYVYFEWTDRWHRSYRNIAAAKAARLHIAHPRSVIRQMISRVFWEAQGASAGSAEYRLTLHQRQLLRDFLLLPRTMELPEERAQLKLVTNVGRVEALIAEDMDSPRPNAPILRMRMSVLSLFLSLIFSFYLSHLYYFSLFFLSRMLTHTLSVCVWF
jgi:hypothetical protein